jgi:hypothetical protein
MIYSIWYIVHELRIPLFGYSNVVVVVVVVAVGSVGHLTPLPLQKFGGSN